jgi:hypothetical protein
MSMPSAMRPILLALALSIACAASATAADYAGAISAYRRAHGLPAVKLDARLNAAALKQAQAMAATGSISHSAAGSFSSRVAPLRKSRAAENIGAGFLTFAEMLKEWENSAGHRENLLLPGMRRVGVAFVDNPKSPYRKFWAMLITVDAIASFRAREREPGIHMFLLLDSGFVLRTPTMRNCASENDDVVVSSSSPCSATN